jgi:hypothetical protein
MRKIEKKNRRFLRLTGAVAIALALACAWLPAEAVQPAPRWKTGTEFQRALLSPMGDVFFSAGTPLRQALERLAAAQGVALMLDRRLDPGQEIEIAARDKSLSSVLDQLAAQCGGTVSHVGPVAYLGPRARTANLSQIAQQRRREADQLPRGMSRRAVAVRDWRWAVLAEPRALLDALADQAGFTIEGMERVPHDLWPAVDLPPLTWTDRMTLVLAGFDLTFEFVPEAQRVRLVPLVPPDLITRSYPTTATPEQLNALAAEFPTARFHLAGQGIAVEGTVEEHHRLEHYLKGAPAGKTRPRAGQTTVHSMRVDNQPIGAVVKTLEQQLGLQFEIDPDAAERLTQRVTFSVRDASLESLLTEALAPAGLAHRRVGERIVIEVDN